MVDIAENGHDQSALSIDSDADVAVIFVDDLQRGLIQGGVGAGVVFERAPKNQQEK